MKFFMAFAGQNKRDVVDKGWTENSFWTDFTKVCLVGADTPPIGGQITKDMQIAQKLALKWMLALVPAVGLAGSLEVQVTASDGSPVPDVVVWVDDPEPSTGTPEPAQLDQIDRRFVPHILVVQRGAEVAFPNSDSVAHHVYSFSKPNDFRLPLYKGTPPDPVRFEHEGIVTVGCNIHDDMLAYVAVVDTPHFALTGPEGLASLQLGDQSGSSIRVTAWSPRIRGKKGYRTLEVPAGESSVVFRLEKKLRSPHQQGQGRSRDY